MTKFWREKSRSEVALLGKRKWIWDFYRLARRWEMWHLEASRRSSASWARGWDDDIINNNNITRYKMCVTHVPRRAIGRVFNWDGPLIVKVKDSDGRKLETPGTIHLVNLRPYTPSISFSFHFVFFFLTLSKFNGWGFYNVISTLFLYCCVNFSLDANKKYLELSTPLIIRPYCLESLNLSGGN